MRVFNLHDEVQFDEEQAHAESIHSNDEGRALRFALLPNQKIENFQTPSSPVHLVVLQGKGTFVDANGEEKFVEAGTLVVFDANETHSVYTKDEKLVYIAIYNENPVPYNSEHRKMLEKEGYPLEE